MLFAIKNRLFPTLLFMTVLAAGSFQLHTLLSIPWHLTPTSKTVPRALLGLAVIIANDGLVHGALLLGFGRRYRARYQALADYFRPQRLSEIASAGLLAGSEELFFRGVLLAGLISRAGWRPGAALVLSALLFGAAHRLRDPRLAPFALWAVWEGVLLGGVYLAFGSLLVSVLVHAAHDIIGFSLFAWRRNRDAERPDKRRRERE